MEKIYVITETFTREESVWYKNSVCTWTKTSEEAALLLSETLAMKQRLHEDLKVLDYSDEHLHIKFSDEEGKSCYSSWWVREVKQVPML